MWEFFKLSKNTQQNSTTYKWLSDLSEGSTVLCMAKKENAGKLILIKKGGI